MKFVDDARKAYRWISVQAMAWAIAIQGGWQALSDDMKANLPAGLVHYLTIGLLVLGIVGRVVKQKDKP